MTVNAPHRATAGQEVGTRTSNLVTMHRRRMWTYLLAVTATAGAVLPGGLAGAAAAPVRPGCASRVLVLSAMPVELSPLLGQAREIRRLDARGHTFWLGRLRGQDVALALTGIGPVNASRTTRAAMATFRCSGRSTLSAVMFSGVAGGDFIGDVIVPRHWTLDAGAHVLGASRRLLRVAQRVAAHPPRLERRTPAGDPLCTCAPLPAIRTTRVTHAPRIEIGGTGQTTDPFSGHALPCVPGGGDVFGCEPCLTAKDLAADAAASMPGMTALADPNFFAGYLSTSEPSRYVVEDEETAAVDAVAAHRHVPFLGIRAVSDGGGDPLDLPGFPVQFFVYRQLAADNAARTTLAVLGLVNRQQ